MLEVMGLWRVSEWEFVRLVDFKCDFWWWINLGGNFWEEIWWYVGNEWYRVCCEDILGGFWLNVIVFVCVLCVNLIDERWFFEFSKWFIFNGGFFLCLLKFVVEVVGKLFVDEDWRVVFLNGNE